MIEHAEETQKIQELEAVYNLRLVATIVDHFLVHEFYNAEILQSCAHAHYTFLEIWQQLLSHKI